MANVFFSPGKYVQGPGELKQIGQHAKKLGEKALILISANGKKRFGRIIEDSFSVAGCSCILESFNGECCGSEINRLITLVQERGCDLMIGVGGGKVLDTAKAVAHYADTPVIVCPTVASTDAPCSALSVVYTDEGVFQEYLFLKRNPDVVLVDTEMIAASPLRLTVAGMGDALATYFEAHACAASNADTCAGGKVGNAALALAKLCYDTLMADGLTAKKDLEQKQCTDAVERIIEANTLLSGIGFESGGLAGAHAIHNGMTVLEECHHMNHGEKVAFGTLTQLVLENAPELESVMDWCISLGLPVTLGELGVTDVSREHILPAAQAACAPNDTIGNLPCPVTPDLVCDAMLKVDAMGRERLKKQA